MVDSGATQFFKKMDIGSLDIGDYLGTHLCYSFLFPVNLFAVWFLLYSSTISAIGAIFAATDSVCTLQVWQISAFLQCLLTVKVPMRHWTSLNVMVQVLNQDETPLLYSLVFGEGVVNDATSVVLFNAIQSFDLNHIDPRIALHFIGNFFYLFITSTMLGVLVSLSLSLTHTHTHICLCYCISMLC